MWGPHIMVAMRAYLVNVYLSAPVVSQITTLSSPLEMIHLFVILYSSLWDYGRIIYSWVTMPNAYVMFGLIQEHYK